VVSQLKNYLLNSDYHSIADAVLLEQIINTNPSQEITREEIIAQVKKDVANLDFEDMPRLVRTYVTKIYAYDNEVIVTGGVTMNDCERTFLPSPNIAYRKPNVFQYLFCIYSILSVYSAKIFFPFAFSAKTVRLVQTY
jgi:hypothetical protein